MTGPKGNPHGNRSRIEMELTEEDRQELDRLLVSGRLTLAALVEMLQGKGYNISRSSIGRYKERFEAVAGRLRESRQMTAAMMQELGESKQGQQGQVLVEMARTLADDFIATRIGGDPLEAKELASLGKGLADLARAARMDQDFEIKIAEARAAARAEVEAEARARLEKLAPKNSGKLSEMTTEELEKAIIKAIAHE